MELWMIASLCTNKRVQQTIQVSEDRALDAQLRQLLKQYHGNNRQDQVLVFALYNWSERLEYSKQNGGSKCFSIHGNKQQAARTATVMQFNDGSSAHDCY